MRMSSSEQPLRQAGIYHNLPSFDSSVRGLKAIVCGATGISGYNAIRALLDTKERWTTIYALSRSPFSDGQLALLTDDQRSRLHHISVDLKSSCEEMAAALKRSGVSAEYVFYYAYLSPKRTGKTDMNPTVAENLMEANVTPFREFLNSLPLAGIKPKRILLQTGGKNYGAHIGRVRTPLVESDPQPRHLAPNFYYEQEDILKEFCRQHPETGWNVIRPLAIVGATQSAAMNFFLSFGIYAAVQAHKKEPLVFGGDFASWQFDTPHSTARLNGYLSEWAVLEERCRNEAFNAQDGGLLSWDRLFHELARWFGIDEILGPESDDSKYQVIELAGGKDAPLGYGPPLRVVTTYRLAQWAQDRSNKCAWEELMKSSGGQLNQNFFENDLDMVFLGDFAYLPFGTLSMNKARIFGFSGFVDTLESIFEAFQELHHLGLLPPMKVDAARPLI